MARTLDGTAVERTLAQEVPVAVVFDGSTAAVMLATPQDLEDFALGFAVSEGFISDPADILSFEIAAHEAGIEARFWLHRDASVALASRRRSMAGPVGCGLCGLDSLDAAARRVPPVNAAPLAFSMAELIGATTALRSHQPLHDETRAVHGAGFLVPGEGIVLAREDVGRHNALDKLIGGLLQSGRPVQEGALVMTSRISVELVQKAAMVGCGVIVAVSAPTAYAVSVAEGAGIALVQTRGDAVHVFTHPEQIAAFHGGPV
ncbi:MAG: formate dehydrogenase accessory sulfurtransferase FdhD [Pseudomonadota bacterium]